MYAVDIVSQLLAGVLKAVFWTEQIASRKGRLSSWDADTHFQGTSLDCALHSQQQLVDINNSDIVNSYCDQIKLSCGCTVLTSLRD